jgi:S1-C subfamily serine protease
VEHYVQTDVVMYPGFSGGPLVNAAGHVIGLNTSALLRNLSLTIPAAALQRIVPMLVQHGRVRRGFMGVTTQRVRLPAPLAAQLGQQTGLLLTAVEPQSPAEQGGFMLGDTLVTIRDTPIRHHDDLVAALDAEQIGMPVSCRIIRGGQVQERSVVLGDRPA